MLAKRRSRTICRWLQVPVFVDMCCYATFVLGSNSTMSMPVPWARLWHFALCDRSWYRQTNPGKTFLSLLKKCHEVGPHIVIKNIYFLTHFFCSFASFFVCLAWEVDTFPPAIIHPVIHAKIPKIAPNVAQWFLAENVVHNLNWS